MAFGSLEKGQKFGQFALLKPSFNG